MTSWTDLIDSTTLTLLQIHAATFG